MMTPDEWDLFLGRALTPEQHAAFCCQMVDRAFCIPRSGRSSTPLLSGAWDTSAGYENERKKFDALPTTTQFGEFVGWRSWKISVTDDGPRLKSSYMNTVWPSGIVTSKDGEGNSANVMGKHHDAGWFAYKTAAQLMQDSESEDVRVGGKVEMWGAVVEHEKGYRAECMRILTLEAIGPRAALVIDDLRAFYIPKGN